MNCNYDKVEAERKDGGWERGVWRVVWGDCRDSITPLISLSFKSFSESLKSTSITQRRPFGGRAYLYNLINFYLLIEMRAMKNKISFIKILYSNCQYSCLWIPHTFSFHVTLYICRDWEYFVLCQFTNFRQSNVLKMKI